jgi:hypothetical protein
MTLSTYTQRTQLLLNDMKMERFNLFDLRSYVNTARGQLAGESECIREYTTLALAINTQVYPLSSVTLPTGASSIIAVRQASVQVGDGAQALYVREFPFFQQYYLNQPVPLPGRPSIYSQYFYGSTGTLYFSPVPDATYTVNVDSVCLPVDLTDDTTTELIPALWTDAVPYYAAYLAYLTAQDGQNADSMMKQYSDFVSRARRAATPSVLPVTAPQVPDATQGNKLGIQRAAG